MKIGECSLGPDAKDNLPQWPICILQYPIYIFPSSGAPRIALPHRQARLDVLQAGLAQVRLRFGRQLHARWIVREVGPLGDLAGCVPPDPGSDGVGVVILPRDRLLAVFVPPGPNAFLPSIDVDPVELLLTVGEPVGDLADGQVVAELALLGDLAVGVPDDERPVLFVLAAGLERGQFALLPAVGRLDD